MENALMRRMVEMSMPPNPTMVPTSNMMLSPMYNPVMPSMANPLLPSGNGEMLGRTLIGGFIAGAAATLLVIGLINKFGGND